MLQEEELRRVPVLIFANKVFHTRHYDANLLASCADGSRWGTRPCSNC